MQRPERKNSYSKIVAEKIHAACTSVHASRARNHPRQLLCISMPSEERRAVVGLQKNACRKVAGRASPQLDFRARLDELLAGHGLRRRPLQDLGARYIFLAPAHQGAQDIP